MLPPIPSSFRLTLRLVSQKIITLELRPYLSKLQSIRSHHNKTATPPTTPATPFTTAIIAPSVALALITIGEPPPPSELVLITSDEAPLVVPVRVLVAAGNRFSHPVVTVIATSSVSRSKSGALIVLTKVSCRVEVESVTVDAVLKTRL